MLSGIALISRTSSGPTFRTDHTLIDRAHDRLSMATIAVARRRMTAIGPAPYQVNGDSGCGGGFVAPNRALGVEFLAAAGSVNGL